MSDAQNPMKLTRICGNVPEDLARAIKVEAAKRGCTIGDVIRDAFAARMLKIRNPDYD